MKKFNASGVVNVDASYDGPAGFQNHSSNLSAIETWFAVNSPTSNALSTFATVRQTMYAVPFWTPRTNVYIDRIAINCTTLSAGSGIIGLYSNCSDTIIYPSGKLYVTPNFSNGTTGVKSTAVGIKLDPGSLYWFVYHCSSPATLRGTAANQTHGWRNAGVGPDMLPITHYAVGRTYDSMLPDIYSPIGPTGVVLPGRAYPTGIFASTVPAIYVRYAQ